MSGEPESQPAPAAAPPAEVIDLRTKLPFSVLESPLRRVPDFPLDWYAALAVIAACAGVIACILYLR